MTAPGPNESDFDFSIVVPTYNRSGSLVRCLQALDRLDYPKARYEVIIVDDGGDQPLDRLISKSSGGMNVSCIRQQNSGPARARNVGLKVARGTYVAMTDDDCSPSPDWLTRLQSCFDRSPHDAVAGRATNGLSGNDYSSASQLLVDFLLEYFNSNDVNQRFGTSNNLAFPRQPLLDIGGFDESFPLSAAEDRELVERWVNTGHRLHYDPAVQVVHFHEMDFTGFLRQHMNYGRGAHRYHALRARNSSGSVSKEPLSFYLNMLKYPFRKGFGIFRGTWISILIFWSQIANAFGYFREKWAG